MFKEHNIKWIPEMPKTRYPSEKELMKDELRSIRYNVYEREENLTSTLNHFFHKPFAKWEGRV